MTGYVRGRLTDKEGAADLLATARESIVIVKRLNIPRLNLDGTDREGNLIALCRQALPFIGETQVADVPRRCEPSTGEINFARISQALAKFGYEGPVGLEAWASGDPTAALDAFRMAFTVLPEPCIRSEARHA